MPQTKHAIRERFPKIYSQDLLSNLFRHPYTKIEFIKRDLGVSRPTATTYLEQLAAAGVLTKQKMGRTNYFINEQLFTLLMAQLTSGLPQAPLAERSPDYGVGGCRGYGRTPHKNS